MVDLMTANVELRFIPDRNLTQGWFAKLGTLCRDIKPASLQITYR